MNPFLKISICPGCHISHDQLFQAIFLWSCCLSELDCYVGGLFKIFLQTFILTKEILKIILIYGLMLFGHLYCIARFLLQCSYQCHKTCPRLPTSRWLMSGSYLISWFHSLRWPSSILKWYQAENYFEEKNRWSCTPTLTVWGTMRIERWTNMASPRR